MNYIKKLMFEKRHVFGIFLFLIFLIITGILLLSLSSNYFNFFDNRIKTHQPIIEIHALSIIILTIVLVMIAWIQSKEILKTSRGDFLMRIDDRYGSPDIIKARKIIHDIYLQEIPNEDDKKNNPTKWKDMQQDRMSIIIVKMEEDKSAYKSEEFICLLNFLDFFETIAYFCNKGDISSQEVEELMGCSFRYYCNLFKKFIDSRRQYYNKNDYYSEIYKYMGMEWSASKK